MARSNSAVKPLQQHADVSLAEATNIANTQLITASADLEIETDLVAANSGAGMVLTLPALAFAIPGKLYQVKQLGVGVVTVTPVAGELIDGLTSRATAGAGNGLKFYAAMGLATPEWLTDGTADATSAPAEGTVVFRSAAQVEALYPAVGTVHTLDPDKVYDFRGPISLGINTFKGHNIVMIGNTALSTLVSTNSANALIESDGDGYINLQGMVFLNNGGPLLNLDLGQTPLSILVMSQVFFTGNKTTGGTGSIGTVVSADRVTIDGSFFVDLDDGLLITGQVNEISMTNCAINPGPAAAAFTGVEIADSSSLDIALFSVVRYKTLNVNDRAMKIGTGATYLKAVRILEGSLRGPGTYMHALGKQKSDRFVLSSGNGEALDDSVFAGVATFTGNTVATVIGSGNQGVLLPVGNGAPTHEVFNGGAFVERIVLSGATTQVQRFTNEDLVTRTYDVELHCELNKAGGGTIFIGLGILQNGVLHAPSRTAVSVGNAATPGYTTATLSLAPTDYIEVRMSNDDSESNVIMNSATWKVKKL